MQDDEPTDDTVEVVIIGRSSAVSSNTTVFLPPTGQSFPIKERPLRIFRPVRPVLWLKSYLQCAAHETMTGTWCPNAGPLAHCGAVGGKGQQDCCAVGDEDRWTQQGTAENVARGDVFHLKLHAM
jgi:hypothetical protein